MSHQFADKLFVFIGTPIRCSRQAARDALAAVGGVWEERFSVYTHYTVAFNGAERTKLYEKAKERDGYGQTVLLSEEQFFNVLEGKAGPPEKKVFCSPNTIVFPAKKSIAIEYDQESAVSNAVKRKRLNNMATHGIPMPDGSRMKVDLRPLDLAIRIEKLMRENQ